MIAVAQRTEAVHEALHRCGELTASDQVMSVQQLAGGWSRHSFLALVRRADGTERHYVVRARPDGALLDTDLGLEYRVYRALEREPIPMARAYAVVTDEQTPFGGPFMVMEHVTGSAPNMYGRDDQARLAADWDGPRAIAGAMADTIAQIHAVDTATLPEELPELGFQDVVARWREVYEERQLLRDPVVEEAFAWVAGREPAVPWRGLVHGDYRVGNTLIADGMITAILDWELAYVGDVRFDLGYLSIPRAAGKHLRAHSPLMGTFAQERWFFDRYAAQSGREVDPDAIRTFQMLGIMMLLATQFTAVWMYAAGATTDVRMAWSRFSFAGLRQDMVRLMGW